MATTLIDADRFVKAKTFAFGTTAASGGGLVTINNGTAATSTVVLDIKGSQNILGNLVVSGVITNPKIAQINDTTNNLAVTAFVAPALSVNYITFTSSITGNSLTLSATGTDANINLNLLPKGTGTVQVNGVSISSGSFKKTTVAGTQDGANRTFTIGNSLGAGTDLVYLLGGPVLDNNASTDYTISGTTLTFNAIFPAPLSTDTIVVRGNF